MMAPCDSLCYSALVQKISVVKQKKGRKNCPHENEIGKSVLKISDL